MRDGEPPSLRTGQGFPLLTVEGVGGLRGARFVRRPVGDIGARRTAAMFPPAVRQAHARGKSVQSSGGRLGDTAVRPPLYREPANQMGPA